MRRYIFKIFEAIVLCNYSLKNNIFYVNFRLWSKWGFRKIFVTIINWLYYLS